MEDRALSVARSRYAGRRSRTQRDSPRRVFDVRVLFITISLDLSERQQGDPYVCASHCCHNLRPHSPGFLLMLALLGIDLVVCHPHLDAGFELRQPITQARSHISSEEEGKDDDAQETMPPRITAQHNACFCFDSMNRA